MELFAMRFVNIQGHEGHEDMEGGLADYRCLSKESQQLSGEEKMDSCFRRNDKGKLA
jgi:hypothetical protein